MSEPLSAEQVKRTALECGFEIAGITRAEPCDDYARYEQWTGQGMAGELTYLTDHRGDLRQDSRNMLPSARSILCVGKLYNSPYPYSTELDDDERAWISRYAWGADYHEILRDGLQRVVSKLIADSGQTFDWRICVDTAPLLERSYSRLAGLGWIGKNTCLINQQHGSWFFLGELLLSVELAADSPPPDRCGTCRRCIDACPTQALVEAPDGSWTLDANNCISYLTIEKRGTISPALHEAMGRHVFGCDICQDVCPWNRRECFTVDEAFHPRMATPQLTFLADLSEDEFRRIFRSTPVWRAKYRGMLRNVAIAMGNARSPDLLEPLHRLAANEDVSVSEAARLAIRRIETSCSRDI